LSCLASQYKVRTVTDNRKALEKEGVVVLAVKPQVIAAVAEEIAPSLGPGMLVISIAAGVNLSRLRDLLRCSRIIRVMPNTPALVLQGITCICQDGARAEDLDVVREVFNSVGKVLVMEERYMDAVTGLSGSGPAYFFLVVEALADGGVKMGLPRAVAIELAVQTMRGAAALLEGGSHPGALKDMVASPGGTTICGIHALERGGVRAAFMDAVERATLRSRELGKA
jgi:pyrroline-5-carboxylate reductase